MSGLHGQNARSHVDMEKSIAVVHVLVMVVANIMRIKAEIAILETVLVNGQTGVDALFRVEKDLKLAHDHVKGIIAVKIYRSPKNVVNEVVLAVGRTGVDALFRVEKDLKLAHDHVKGIIAVKIYKSRKNVVNQVVLANGRTGVNALFRVGRDLKLVRDYVKETVVKIFAKVRNADYNLA